jgi:hypothetical protein
MHNLPELFPAFQVAVGLAQILIGSALAVAVLKVTWNQYGPLLVPVLKKGRDFVLRDILARIRRVELAVLPEEVKGGSTTHEPSNKSSP